MADDLDRQTGRLAVDRGLITQVQLDRALQALDEARAGGAALSLSEFLVQRGFLTQSQLDGLLVQPPESPKPTEIIEGYEILNKLGEGGMGSVYLARQVGMGRLVALKVLPRRLSRNSKFLHRFIREAQLAGKLNHVNLVQAFDVGESRGYYFLAMEYVEGRTARDLVDEKGPLEEGEALHLVLQIARALEAAHEFDIVHRDVKPDNILVRSDGVAKLSDLGLAREAGDDSSLTQSGVAVGTAHYISPEQARGRKDVDIRADIYSLGATLYHLLASRTPYDGDTAAVVMTKHLTERVKPIREVNPKVSKNCARLIEKMMAKDREQRYANPAELLRDLELVIDGKAPLGAISVSAESAARRAATGRSQPAKERGRPTTRRARPVTGERRAAGRTSRAAFRVRTSLPLAAVVGIGVGVLVLGVLLGALLRGSLLVPPPDAEQAAQSAWNGSIAPLARKPLDRSDAGKLLGSLKAFEADHGDTRFARGKDGEIADLKERARAAIERTGSKPPGGGTPSVPPPALSALTLGDVSKLFRGKVTEFDQRTLRARVVWYFSNPAEIEDFDRLFPRSVRPKDKKVLLTCSSTETDLLRLPQFACADVQLRINYKLVRKLDEPERYLAVWFGPPGERAKGSFAFFIDSEGYALADRGRTGYRREFARSAGTLPAQGLLVVTLRDGKVKISTGGETRLEDTCPGGDPGASLAIGGGFDLTYEIDSLSIVGRLDRAWLARALKNTSSSGSTTPVPTPPAAGSAYSATWKRVLPSARTAAGRSCEPPRKRLTPAVAYDSKRRRCILYGGGFNGPTGNDLWAYDAGANAWTRLQAHDKGADDVSRPAPTGYSFGSLPFAYDAKRDRYWLHQGFQGPKRFTDLWSFDPSSGRWTKHFVTGQQVAALTCTSKSGLLVGWTRGPRPWILDPDGKTATMKAKSPMPSRAGYTTLWGSGGGSAINPFGRLLIYGGIRWSPRPITILGDTWFYMPRRDQWTEGKPKETPGPRSTPNLAWHDGLRAWVLFGGKALPPGKTDWTRDKVTLTDTWVYNPKRKNWFQAADARGAPPGAGALWYDAARDLCVLFTEEGGTWTLKVERK